MEVERDPPGPDPLRDCLQDPGNLTWMRDTDRVADRNFEAPHLNQGGRNPGDAFRRDVSFERTAKCRRYVPADLHAPFKCTRADGAIRLQRFVDRLVDVATAERLGCGCEHRDLR